MRWRCCGRRGTLTCRRRGGRNLVVYVPEYQRRQIARTERFDLVDRYRQGRIYREAINKIVGRAVMLFRPGMVRDMDMIPGAWDGARVIWSQWDGYLTSPANEAFRAGLEARRVPLDVVHTSGAREHRRPAASGGGDGAGCAGAGAHVRGRSVCRAVWFASQPSW